MAETQGDAIMADVGAGSLTPRSGVRKGIWVAVPAYTGQICVETAHSLNVEMLESFNRGIPFLLTFHEQDSIITRCRNCMVMNFLASDPAHFTDMIFIDSDVGFPQGALIRLAEHPRDVVGAVYPYRKDPLDFPVQFIDGKAGEEIDTGLTKVAGLPAGFLKISRKALELIMAKFPDHWYYEANVPQGKAFRFFDFVTINNKFFGEDYAFCALAREAGLDIWCDTDITLKHVGAKHFVGNLKEFIDSKNPDKAADPFAALHEFNKRVAS